MNNSVLITQVLLPNLISTLIMVIVSSLIATIIGFALAVVLIITNKQGLAPNAKIYRLLDFYREHYSFVSVYYFDGGTDAVYSFHR